MSYNKKLKSGVFIDGSNVTWGSLNMHPSKRWFVDFIKLKAELKKQYNPQLFRYYGAVDTKPTSEKFVRRAERQAKMYAKLGGAGYDVVTKPLKYIKNKDGGMTTKGDMDIELTMGIMQAMSDLDTIILVSGDSDYLEPVKLMHSEGKYIRIISFEELLSWELRTFAIKNTRCSYKTFDEMKEKIEHTRH